MKAVILAAGYATRLYPLTRNTPKCLLEIGGRTILDILVGKIERLSEVSEILIVTNAKFFEPLDRWRRAGRRRVPVRLLNDGTTSNETRLGAIGDLGFAIREGRLREDILMAASDNLYEEELGGFVRFARSKKGAVCVAVYDIQDPALAVRRLGVIETAADGRITGMEEKPEHPRGSLIGVGVYFFPRQSLALVRDYLAEKPSQDAPGYYILWLHEKGIQIFSFPFRGMWYDIGDLKSLEEAKKKIRSRVS